MNQRFVIGGYYRVPLLGFLCPKCTPYGMTTFLWLEEEQEEMDRWGCSAVSCRVRNSAGGKKAWHLVDLVDWLRPHLLCPVLLVLSYSARSRVVRMS